MGNGPRIPVGEALLRAQPVIDALRAKSDEVVICGSIRRGEELVGDVDAVVYHLRTFSLGFDSLVWTEDRPKIGYTAGMVLQGSDIKVDVFRCSDRGSWGSIMVYATGPREFNFTLERILGKDIWDTQAPTEEYFFKNVLHIPFIPPSLRGDPAYIKQMGHDLTLAVRKYGDDNLPNDVHSNDQASLDGGPRVAG